MRLLLAAMALWLALSTEGMAQSWVGTWAAAAEFTGAGDMPQTCTLARKSLRQVIRPSMGGNRLQLVLSNEFSREPAEIACVYIAPDVDGLHIDSRKATYVKWNGKCHLTMEPGKTAVSDPISFNLEPLEKLNITICYGANVPANATSHRGSRTTSFIAEGEVKPRQTFQSIEQIDHWYNICQLNVWKENAHSIAVLGNSITDGRGTTTNLQNRWTDIMATELLSAGDKQTGKTPHAETGILNLGIGGNCVVSGGLSEPALTRFDRDILGQKGVETLIIFQGTNDIGSAAEGQSEQVCKQLIDAYQQLIARAKAGGISRVVGCTITPFKGNAWFTHFHEAARQTVNEWIRTGGAFDQVIDFDLLVRDPSDPQRLKPAFSDDWLHLNPEGYAEMGRYAATQLR